ncbi:small GTP-binding protein, putative [Trichomonas vaginalis G3]|uniref:Small GTP-binding protein, putative n=1 Tax=Trichomonas vaginalis (strain ATCC PRA-98 / G3) TaxID=412133 RepID=A2DL05_TRIV3|nr:GTPase protein [Trichomonas vaginalis G3]EAY18958.1 small GTP-binding protein, putative [Trichomonas vaginalis G3]KAI5532024.1 GTPase protein [Trichomonas vaginalis G3]|eukprot:XP_001579944.1 small GTP-binding protein [Trichomonas vaginalis G3]
MFVDSSIVNCRIIVIGDTLVGKTCLLNRLVFGIFNENQASTIGATHQIITKEIDGRILQVQIWDTAGQEKFKSLGPIYFRNSSGAIAVYDETNAKSFENLSEWIKSFRDVAGPNTVIAVAANKSDCTDQKQVAFGKAKQWADQNKYLIRETSAKEGEGISDLFMELATTILRQQTTLNGGNSGAQIQVFASEKENKCSC